MSLSVVADENMPGVAELLPPDTQLRLLPGRSIRREDLAQADALLVRSVTRVDAELLSGTRVRFVGTATSGVDHIDRAWLTAQGIAFAHAPGANANSVVEYVLAAIAEADNLLEQLLDGAVVGIVGYGHVGRTLAARLQALGIGRRIFDPWLAQVPDAASLAELLGCELLCLHPELTDAQPWPSRHLLDAQALAHLGDSQWLVNASRGPVVDNQALLARLQAPQPPSVVLDVWEQEPLVNPALLAQVRFGTAHIAGYSWDSKWRASAKVCEALLGASGLVEGIEPAPPLHLPSGLGTADAIRHLLRQRYRINEDDQLLRDALAATTEPAGAAFDRLRRDYRQRRELAGSRVQLAPGAESQAGLVRALGAVPEPAS